MYIMIISISVSIFACIINVYITISTSFVITITFNFIIFIVIVMPSPSSLSSAALLLPPLSLTSLLFPVMLSLSSRWYNVKLIWSNLLNQINLIMCNTKFKTFLFAQISAMKFLKIGRALIYKINFMKTASQSENHHMWRNKHKNKTTNEST